VAKPDFEWYPEHLAECRRALDSVTRGDCKRLMLFLPPRHGKSELATIHYTAYRLLIDQTLRVIVGAYNHGLACTFSRQSRRIAKEFGFEFSDDQNKQNQWSSQHGGGLYAVGVGSGVTGYGADLLIIDDPVKSRAEAESPTYRARVMDWYQNDLYTRLHPGAAIVLIMTRWHSLDLAGQLLEQAQEGGEQWQVVSLPAIAEQDDAIGRPPGEALWPDRYSVEDFKRIKAAIGSYPFEALYQQTPTPRAGGFFRPQWFKIVDPSPIPFDSNTCRAWDTAATVGGGDYTAGVRISKTGDNYRIHHASRGQWSPATRRTIQRQIADTDGRETIIHLAQDPGSAGVDQVQNDISNLIGYGVISKRPTGSKEVRAMPIAAALESGIIQIDRGEWNRDFIDELCAFPTGRNDDQVDAIADAFNYLSAIRPFRYVS